MSILFYSLCAKQSGPIPVDFGIGPEIIQNLSLCRLDNEPNSGLRLRLWFWSWLKQPNVIDEYLP
jgi:hypothetical protein